MKRFQPIAVIGRACLLPGCFSPDELWKTVYDGEVRVNSPPEGKFRVSMERIAEKSGDIPPLAESGVSDRGGYISGFKSVFNAGEYLLDTELTNSLSPLFQWSFHSAGEALKDSGYFGDAPARTGLIMGNLSYPDAFFSEFFEQVYLEELFPGSIMKTDSKIHPLNRFMSGLPAVMTGQALGLKGDCFALDAACSSTLYAVKLACDRLSDGSADMMLAGGINAADQLFLHIGFTSLKAMSLKGEIRPFSREADGLLPAEGAAFAVLKTLDKALKDGDNILGVIRGIGLSNDGRSGGFLSPSSEGQIRCMELAFSQTDLKPTDISFVECHATGTPVGDAIEIQSMSEIFGQNKDLVIGSHKANFGHLITASGGAGLVKILECMRNGYVTSTPMARPLSDDIENSPFQVLEKSEKWERKDGKRRACVSNFGFGGNNAHMIVEEWREKENIKSFGVGYEPRPATKIAVTGIGIRTDRIKDSSEFLEFLLSGRTRPEGSLETVSFQPGEVVFPPKDLKAALGQQLMLLKAAQEALGQVKNRHSEETGVFIGMSADAEINRYTLRWRLYDLMKRADMEIDESWLEKAENILNPPLEPAAVIGAMPNIPANRINNQYNFSGQGFTVSAEELSGDMALEIAVRSLAENEIKVALVGAVDMSREKVHQKAARKILGPEQAENAADAAAVLLLKRYEDAEKENDDILAVIDENASDRDLPTITNAADSFLTVGLGHSHAASGMLHVAAAALLTAHKCKPEFHFGREYSAPFIPGKDGVGFKIRNFSFSGQSSKLVLRADERPDRNAGTESDIEDLSESRSGEKTAEKRTKPSIEFFLKKPPIIFPELAAVSAGTTPSTIVEMKPAPELLPVSRIAEAVKNLEYLESGRDRGNNSIREESEAGALELLEFFNKTAFNAFESQIRKQKEAYDAYVSLTNKSVDFLIERMGGEGPADMEPTVFSAPLEKVFSADEPVSTLKSRTEEKTPLTAAKPGPSISRKELEILSSGKISSIFGPLFKQQDKYEVQVRMPEPPLLLCDRVTGIEGEPGSLEKGTIWTETDVGEGSWYLHNGHMPPGYFIEAGQADLLLVSWLGIDFRNKGERAYRLLGCELTFFGGLPKPGETLQYEIKVDGYARQGDVTLFFFRYDCRVNGELRSSVRSGQAGFFTKKELDESKGVIWEPETAEYRPDPKMEAAEIATGKTSFDEKDVRNYAVGDMGACFGPELDWTRSHTRTPTTPSGRKNFIGRVTDFNVNGGPAGRGYLKSEYFVDPDAWFFKGHFKNDPCMPGTLMAEACLQLMAFYMVGIGLSVHRDGWNFQPEADVTYKFICRGQATPESKRITYEIFVDDVIQYPRPTLFAHVLCAVDGVKSFLCEGLGLRLEPDWPLTTMPSLLRHKETSAPIAERDGFRFDYASLINCALGNGVLAFGQDYAHYDGLLRNPRLPGPPYHFISRVSDIQAEYGQLKGSPHITMEYDIPEDAWYFSENGSDSMPYCVLMEIGLQPCGWLSTFILKDDLAGRELLFRNLDGTAFQFREIMPEDGTIRTRSTLTSASKTGEVIIVRYDVECFVKDETVFSMKTAFGFFTPESMMEQKGLPVSEEEFENLHRDGNLNLDLRTRPSKYFKDSSVRLPWPKLLMIDRVAGYWPNKGKAGLGYLRAEKYVNAGDWFFKSHFFQDPVQPGSLGVEAVIQLMQFYMLHSGRGQNAVEPRFEPILIGGETKWSYRGQVTPDKKLISVDLEILEEGEDDKGEYVVAEARLWVDGLKIYHLPKIGVGITDGVREKKERIREWELDINDNRWLEDHMPTYTIASMPLTGKIDMMARSVDLFPGKKLTALENAETKRWLSFQKDKVKGRTVVTPLGENKARVKLQLFRRIGKMKLDFYEDCVEGVFVFGDDYDREPAPEIPPLEKGEKAPNPYEDGSLFHGHSFQMMKEWIVGSNGASAVMDPAPRGVPVGILHPAFLDAALHCIPHDNLNWWCPEAGENTAAYPVRVKNFRLREPLPIEGTIRVEARFAGLEGGALATTDLWILRENEVIASFSLVEFILSKGFLGRIPAVRRGEFVRNKKFIGDYSVIESDGAAVSLSVADVRKNDWLAGTIAAVYGLNKDASPADLTRGVLIKERLSRLLFLNPYHIVAGGADNCWSCRNLPLNGIKADVEENGERVVINSLEIEDSFSLKGYFDESRYDVAEDLKAMAIFAESLEKSMLDRFIGKVILRNPAAFYCLRGKPVLYLGNHQTALESALFCFLVRYLAEIPIRAIAKEEHRGGWVTKLYDLGRKIWGDGVDMDVSFFNREDPSLMLEIFRDVKRDFMENRSSLMVHIEGTRAFTAGHVTTKISSFIADLAVNTNAHIIPVRFCGGLPLENDDEKKYDFPVNLGRQDYYFGSSVPAHELKDKNVMERNEIILESINSLGPLPENETPLPFDPDFNREAAEYREKLKVSEITSVYLACLNNSEHVDESIRRIVTDFIAAGVRPEEMDEDSRGRGVLEFLLSF